MYYRAHYYRSRSLKRALHRTTANLTSNTLTQTVTLSSQRRFLSDHLKRSYLAGVVLDQNRAAETLAFVCLG